MKNWPLTRLLGSRPRPYLAQVGLWTVLRSTVLLSGLMLALLFDRLQSGDRAQAALWAFIAAVVGSEFARIFLWYGVMLSRLEPSYTFGVRAALRDRVLAAVLRRPAAAALDRPVGDVISRFGDDVDELGVYAIWSASNVSRIVVALAAVGIMLGINVTVTLALTVPVIVVTLAARTISGRIGNARAASRRAGGEVSAIVGESMTGIQALQAARAEPRMVARLRRAGDVRRRTAVREELLIAVQGALLNSTAAAATGLVLLVAAAAMRANSFSVGDLALFVFYIQFVAQAVASVAMFFSRIKRAHISLDRLGEVAGAAVTTLAQDEPSGSAAGPDGSLGELRVSGLCFSHPGTGRGIRDVDLTLRPGTLTVVTGQVGSGKSTLIKTILGLLPADSGEIRWNGAPVPEPGEFFVPPRSAYVPQAPLLFSGTLRDNVLLGREDPDDAVLGALHAAVFEDDLAQMQDGLDATIGPRGLRLSGGQVQRVAVARMLVRGPQLLVVDDVASAVDSTTEEALWDGLLAGGATVLAISHRAQLLAHADQVVVLSGGRVVGTGEPAAVRASCPELRELWTDGGGAEPGGIEAAARPAGAHVIEP